MLPLERDPTNPHDKFAVAVKKCGETVGHLPFNVAPVVSAFLSRPANKALVEVTGSCDPHKKTPNLFPKKIWMKKRDSLI